MESYLDSCLAPPSKENTSLQSFMWPFGTSRICRMQLTIFVVMGSKSKAFLKLTKTITVPQCWSKAPRITFLTARNACSADMLRI
ncbi:hypothetical protein ACTXT7_011083, partial [Hymenolepis weldensis]